MLTHVTVEPVQEKTLSEAFKVFLLAYMNTLNFSERVFLLAYRNTLNVR